MPSTDLARWLAARVIAWGLLATDALAQTISPAAAPQLSEAEAERQRIVVEQFLTGRVEDALNQAKADVRTNPRAAFDVLKQALQAVINTPDISVYVRVKLRKRLETALRAAAALLPEDSAVVKELLTESPRAYHLRQLESLLAKDRRMKALLTSMTCLIDEEHYRAAELLRDPPEHSPFFADEPPLFYPDPEVWDRLTARRRSYSAADRPSEVDLIAALEREARLECIETPLADVLEFLKDEHEIPIQFDKKALEDEGLDCDMPVSANLAGVTLRTALAELLYPLELTYQIKNEVLLVTTQVKAAEDLIARVYPMRSAWELCIKAPRSRLNNSPLRPGPRPDADLPGQQAVGGVLCGAEGLGMGGAMGQGGAMGGIDGAASGGLF